MSYNSSGFKVITFAGLSIFGCHSAQAQVQRLPNILHINTDDHRPDGLHALGNPVIQTPNLDQLVERGMTFSHCYTMGSMTGAVCMPSRTMLLTGRSWQRIPGALAAEPDADDPVTYLPRIIAAAGYQTWHMGKRGNGFLKGLQEFETSIIDDAKGDTPENNRAYSSQRLADSTIRFLKSRTANHETKPFYVYLAPPVPHDPRSAESQFHKLYDPAKIPLSPAFMPQHPWDNGEMTIRDEKLAPWPRTPGDTKQQTADYYACITGLDYYIGKIFEELKTSGQWNNTIIIFSGDNGLSLGEHGLFGKQNLYEYGGMHVPLVIAGPGIPKGTSEALVYLMDLFPTFADFAGAQIPAAIEGKSLVPILTGKEKNVREVLYTAYRDCQRSIRDDRWKLIRYPLVDRTQLFDLKNDPNELINLANESKYSAKLKEMTALLEKEMNVYADTFPLTVANPKPAEWIPPPTQLLSDKKLFREIAQPAVFPPASPRYSDVCMRLFHIQEKVPRERIITAGKDFHINWGVWSYINDKSFIKEAKTLGWQFQGSVNAMTYNPDNALKGGNGQALKMGERYWADPANRGYREEILKEARLWIDNGATSLHRDDPEFGEWWWDRRAKRLGADFQRDAIPDDELLEFHTWFRNEIEKYAGHRLTVSVNSSHNRSFIGCFDYRITEVRIANLNPSGMWQISKDARKQGMIFAVVGQEEYPIEDFRRIWAGCYATGNLFVVPWDQFNVAVLNDPKAQRTFVDPKDLADLSGFVRANAMYLDGYEDAAVSGYDLKENRYGSKQPIEIENGSGKLSAFVRARPADPDAPVVIHLVEFDKGAPAIIKLPTQLFFGGSSLKVRLRLPAPYDSRTHNLAESTKDYSLLVQEEILTPTVDGQWTILQVPACKPWAILVVERQ